jgi:hypothetical protein
MPFGSGECQLSVSSGLHFHGYWPSFQSSAPINRATDLTVLKEKFETPTPNNPTGKSAPWNGHLRVNC